MPKEEGGPAFSNRMFMRLFRLCLMSVAVFEHARLRGVVPFHVFILFSVSIVIMMRSGYFRARSFS